MAEIINLFGNNGITLSTGYFVDANVQTFDDSFQVLDHLLNATVGEHLKEIGDTSPTEGDYAAFEIIKKEVQHLVDNEFTDHKEALRWILETLVVQRFYKIIKSASNKMSDYESDD